MSRFATALLERPWARRYASLVREDLASAYTRDLRRWLLAAPILGVVTGLLITALVGTILLGIWPTVLGFDLRHPLAIVPILAGGFLVAGLLMQHLTPDPDEHSTEEVIRSYHERRGRVDLRAFVPKLLAAVATVGSGGSAALEGPSIYGGGAIGSWLWGRLRFAKLGERDRRIMLIAGAAAGMSAVFRAPLTGIVFALEMPYKDDLAHEALLPSVIASVVSYATVVVFVGSRPIFDFAAAAGYTRMDLAWSVLLGAGCGLAVMAFDLAFRRFRGFVIGLRVPHWAKMTVGGALTGLCGLLFVSIYHGGLIPIGPNYEAVGKVLQGRHGSGELVVFGVLKLAATLFSLGVGGVSAMFVPLFLVGGSFGTAFGQAIVHAPAPELFAAVGMAAFLAGGYKAPLTAVVFVAEATGGHAFIVPTLVGAAVSYMVSGEASASGDQRLHETTRVAELVGLSVGDAMRRDVVGVQAAAPLAELARTAGAGAPHAVYPVCEGRRVVGLVATTALSGVPPEEWEDRHVGAVATRSFSRVPADCGLQEALRMLVALPAPQILLVTTQDDELEGIVTAADVLAAIDRRAEAAPGAEDVDRRRAGALP